MNTKIVWFKSKSSVTTIGHFSGQIIISNMLYNVLRIYYSDGELVS